VRRSGRRSLSFRRVLGLAAGGVALAGAMAATPTLAGPLDVLTQHGNNARTGADLRETALNTADVNPQTFGKLWTRDVDGYLYAQPLYVQNVAVPGQGLHNVVFCATAHNSVYAFDADDPKAAAPLWKVSLGPSVPASDIYTGQWTDMVGEIGITSTPVIDLDSKTIFVETKNKEGGADTQRLHALDLATGREKPGSPVLIQATTRGTGDGSVGGVLTFDPLKQLQRPGLLLLNGVVYLAFGGHADIPPYHGWILGYDTRTMKQVCVFNTTPNGADGAIWQAGMGMAADESGSLFAMTGNGTFTANTGGTDYGDTFLRLRPSGGTLAVQDYFTPFNQDALNANDVDVGGSGPLLIPDTDLIMGGGKAGVLYVTHQGKMGRFKADSDSQISQSFRLEGAQNIHGSPVFWDGPAGPRVYIWAETDHLKTFGMVQGVFHVTPDAQSAAAAPPGMPGGFLSVSADGGKAGTGIVWACLPFDQNANWVTVPGIVRAYDAADLSHEIWDSRMNAGRDDVGMFAKFCAPTVANGRVYVATFSNQLQVYGLLDGVLPALDSVSATAGHVTVRYKKPVDAVTAARPANYALDNGARVLRASLDADTKTVYLATTPLRPGVQYTLTAGGVRDRANPKLALPSATHAWLRPGAATARR